ncbi:hypothetical protein TNCV_2630891 [Trichonephila clavipes]|nr:hypothetical protein TNCV_2630891 [Trichonephila clavipes]
MVSALPFQKLLPGSNKISFPLGGRPPYMSDEWFEENRLGAPLLGTSIPTDDLVSRGFIESSALEQVITIHPGMATERVGLVSSLTKPVEYTLKTSCPMVR